MKKIKKYFKLQKELYNYFGYMEDWVVFPMEDSTNYWWSIVDDNYDECKDTLPDGRIINLGYGKNTLFCTHDKKSHIKLIEHNWNWDVADIGEKCFFIHFH